MFGLSRRERALKKATGALAEFYQVPHPGPRASLADLPMLAVDVETTGLSPRDDRLLSIGWVPIDGGTITLAGAGHVVLQQRDGTSVGESATIHGLTDDAVRAGMPAAEAVTGTAARAARARDGGTLHRHGARFSLGCLHSTFWR